MKAVKRAKKAAAPRVVWSARIKKDVANAAQKKMNKQRTNKSQLLEQLLYDYISS